MGKPLGKEYSREDMRIATFRISHGQWEDFQRLCSDQGKSASESITAFIDSVIGGDSIPESKSNFPDIEAIVRKQVSEAIAAIAKPEPTEPNLEELAGAVVALLTDEEKKL